MLQCFAVLCCSESDHWFSDAVYIRYVGAFKLVISYDSIDMRCSTFISVLIFSIYLTRVEAENSVVCVDRIVEDCQALLREIDAFLKNPNVPQRI